MENWTRITTNVREVRALLSIRQDVRPEAEAHQIARAADVTPRINWRQMRVPR
ncbi:MAG: hypothetical protein OXN97_04660 [Bryobacterales bacterium]|nr:hypothetical protein [Bryobacterales bacterium]